jgi:hypothetical protein
LKLPHGMRLDANLDERVGQGGMSTCGLLWQFYSLYFCSRPNLTEAYVFTG